ncbi:hypothetical protein B0H21DRAFT_744516 [Amylocystis lapponica]|nr:hypothetical protein B0H21DRAFT_744516 [Amylocystis lapponica]
MFRPGLRYLCPQSQPRTVLTRSRPAPKKKATIRAPKQPPLIWTPAVQCSTAISGRARRPFAPPRKEVIVIDPSPSPPPPEQAAARPSRPKMVPGQFAQSVLVSAMCPCSFLGKKRPALVAVFLNGMLAGPVPALDKQFPCKQNAETGSPVPNKKGKGRSKAHRSRDSQQHSPRPLCGERGREGWRLLSARVFARGGNERGMILTTTMQKWTRRQTSGWRAPTLSSFQWSCRRPLSRWYQRRSMRWSTSSTPPFAANQEDDIEEIFPDVALDEHPEENFLDAAFAEDEGSEDDADLEEVVIPVLTDSPLVAPDSEERNFLDNVFADEDNDECQGVFVVMMPVTLVFPDVGRAGVHDTHASAAHAHGDGRCEHAGHATAAVHDAHRGRQRGPAECGRGCHRNAPEWPPAYNQREGWRARGPDSVTHACELLC